MKHNIVIVILAALLAGSAISCSDLKFGDAFLEKAPGVDVTVDTIFSSKMYAERALVSAYATLMRRFAWVTLSTTAHGL